MTAATKTDRPLATHECLACGSTFTFTFAPTPGAAQSRVVHNCGSYAVGPTWIVYGPVIR